MKDSKVKNGYFTTKPVSAGHYQQNRLLKGIMMVWGRKKMRLATIAASFALATGCHTPHTSNTAVPSTSETIQTLPNTRPVQQIAHVEPAALIPQAAAEETLDLEVALRLAGVENPTINLARERVREAVAEQLAARSLLVPSLNVGGNLRLHQGPLLSSAGEIRTPKLQGLYLGAGAGAVGGNPPAIPGVRLFAHLGDAVYEPLAARQRVTVRRSDAIAVQNQILLEVAVAYLQLVAAEARIDILRQAEKDVAEIVRVTAEFAKAGQGTTANANRATTNAELIRRQLRQAEGESAVASARLCRLLNLDPATQFRSPGGPIELIRLVPEDVDTEQLLEQATRFRPELQAASAAIREAQTRVRQEQTRPLLPIVSVGYSAGGFGGNDRATSPFGSLNDRSDFDVLAVWNIANLGFGNHARVRGADAGVGQAVAIYDATLNRVRSEVVAAQGDAKAAVLQIRVTRTAVAAAEEGFALERERIKLGQGRPIEGLDSFRQLVDARLEYISAMIAFDVAQFRLFVALGNNPMR